MLQTINKLGVLTVTGFTVGLLSTSGLLSRPAYANGHCYKQRLLFRGTWTWVCRPFPRINETQSQSCLGVDVPPNSYRIINRTNRVLNYLINGTSYNLSPKYQRTHKVGGGSGCNIASTEANIKFVSSLRPGMRNEKSYTLRLGLSSNREYVFDERDNSIVFSYRNVR